MLGISACLAGVCCRYDGNHNQIDSLKQLVEEKKAIIVCPEVLGGLSTPRTPAEIVGGDGFDVWKGQAKVIDRTGKDVTAAFKAGAIKAYQEFQKLDVTRLILKERSPSCGSQLIYDGSFSGIRITGVGVATAYFINRGIKVFSEENWQKEEAMYGN
ncbi:DUF523 domain-containing protein [Enterococcus pallens]|uniref:Uncharacterized protein n=1 Tax=Enterococcus pallens ATCC BAA-351 TaxID=1158607 RepID=R2SMB4_9ENTE|nr:DUF523 domain-containing protein [Enterococcus pallens]EOH96295.1 hypothetical protein UAU_00945 [Enterococcus pallens ATCC BAA-351]EOU14492.1 hypothetical protein I588_04849 [Enterococcus pallens ATCC BAA-351]OJG81017.1 hypothetical protein RV10_GL004016 [Enterococcus pallens]